MLKRLVKRVLITVSIGKTHKVMVNGIQRGIGYSTLEHAEMEARKLAFITPNSKLILSDLSETA